ncbi:MAG: VOC family protein [Caldilineaceae bacterium]|nr:VOC family protein [Caldilineaceae bacterium]
MQLNGIHHHSILVSDMERAVDFYKNVMGLQEIGIPSTFPPASARALVPDWRSAHSPHAGAPARCGESAPHCAGH